MCFDVTMFLHTTGTWESFLIAGTMLSRLFAGGFVFVRAGSFYPTHPPPGILMEFEYA